MYLCPINLMFCGNKYLKTCVVNYSYMTHYVTTDEVFEQTYESTKINKNFASWSYIIKFYWRSKW